MRNSNDPTIWSLPHSPCPVSQPAVQVLQNPLRDLVLQMAGRRLSLPRRHALNAGTAASTFRLHCITSLPANQHLERLSTHSPLCHGHCLMSLSAPGACGALCTQGLLWGSVREVGEGESCPSEPQAPAASFLQILLHHTYDVSITEIQYSVCLSPSKLIGQEG